MADLIPREVLFGNPERVSPSISPDGSRLAWIAPRDGVLNVWVAPIAAAGASGAGVPWCATVAGGASGAAAVPAAARASSAGGALGVDWDAATVVTDEI